MPIEPCHYYNCYKISPKVLSPVVRENRKEFSGKEDKMVFSIAICSSYSCAVISEEKESERVWCRGSNIYLFKINEYLFKINEYLFKINEYLFKINEYLFKINEYLFKINVFGRRYLVSYT